MKKIYLLLVMFGLGAMINQTKAQNEQKLNLLDGSSVQYEYEGVGEVKLEFYDGKIKYEWLTGAFEGAVGANFDYNSTKIGDQMYMINWYEKERTTIVTIVFDFKQKAVHSSALLNGNMEGEMVFFHDARIKDYKLKD